MIAVTMWNMPGKELFFRNNEINNCISLREKLSCGLLFHTLNNV